MPNRKFIIISLTLLVFNLAIFAMSSVAILEQKVLEKENKNSSAVGK